MGQRTALGRNELIRNIPQDAIGSNQGNDRGGRGGRGRSMPPAGGRGQGSGGRGDRVSGRGAGAPSGRGASTSRPAAPAAPLQNQTPAQQPVAVPEQAAPVPTPAASNGGTGWGWGGPTSLAEKLKQAEIQKLLPPPAPVVQIVREEVSLAVRDVVCFTHNMSVCSFSISSHCTGYCSLLSLLLFSPYDSEDAC